LGEVAGGRITAWNDVERLINRLEISGAVDARFDKRAYARYGTVSVAAIRLYLWS
jgi:hypothetical protein